MIDLYYQHRVDPEHADRRHRWSGGRARRGRARSATLGLSEAGPDTNPTRAQQVHPIAALQTEYSLWSRDPEDRATPTRYASLASASLLIARLAVGS